MKEQKSKLLRVRVDNRKWKMVVYETEKEKELLLSISRDMDAIRKKDKVYRSKRESIEAKEEILHQEFMSDESVVESINRDELKECLKNSIQKLLPNERRIIYLHFEREMTFQQIAKQMQLSLTSVYVIYKRALKKIKREIQIFI